MITRRALLSTTALIALAGCSALSSTATTSIPQFVTDAETIATGFAQGVLPALASVAGISTSTLGQVQTWVSSLATLASSIASAVSGGSSPNSFITSFGSTVNNIIVALTGSALPATVQNLLTAAQTLLPLILSVAGVALAAPPGGMTPAEARAVLLGRA